MSRRVIYPYPMKISNGYSYMLSIAQFLNALSEEIHVDLLCLDSEYEMTDYFIETLGIKKNSKLNIVSLNNKKFGIKSNKLFFYANVKSYIKKTIKEHEQIFFYSRDIKQMRLGLKNLDIYKNIYFIFEAHQILSQNYCRNGDYSRAKEILKYENYVFNRADLIISITPTLKNEITKLFPLSKKIEVLPVGFDKRYLDLKPINPKYDLIYSGNFSQWKGLDILIEAVEKLKRTYKKPISVLLIGANNDDFNFYKNLVKEKKLLSTIKIIKRVKHKKVRHYVSQSKVGVLSNKFNADGMLFTSPLKLYEYLGAGIIVIAPRLPSIESSMKDNFIQYFRAEDPDDLAKKIIYALTEHKYDIADQKKYASDFTWDRRAEKFNSLLK